VEQAGNDLNRLVDYFEWKFGRAEKVYITGASEGGLIATMLLERRPDTYDGGLARCGPIGGAPYQMQYLGDFRVVFDYFFPSVFPFGMADVPQNAFLAWNSYADNIGTAMATSPFLTEKLFKVTRAAKDPGDPSTAIETAIEVLFYSVWGTNDIVDVAGGQPFGNILHLVLGVRQRFCVEPRGRKSPALPDCPRLREEILRTNGGLAKAPRDPSHHA
jgi:pimeloyl-ACP methyl ester carboxylesterase